MNQGFAASRIPTSTGERPAIASVYPLYSVAAITLATFFGTPMAASWLMAANYRRLGLPGKASTSLWVGFAITLLAVGVGYFLPQSMSLPIGLGLLFGARTAARSLQGPMLDQHLREGGRFESNWKAFAMSLIFLVAYCSVTFAAVYAAA